MILDFLLNTILKVTEPFYYQSEPVQPRSGRMESHPGKAFIDIMSDMEEFKDRMNEKNRKFDEECEPFYLKHPDLRPPPRDES